VDPGDNVELCVSQCEEVVPNFDDDCGAQADAMMNCIEGTGCEPSETDCIAEATAWTTCIAGAFP
jgi:hypothetical protein